MSPAPTLEHQELVGALYGALRDHLRSRLPEQRALTCRVFVAPVDVVLSRDTVVQPDVVVICDAAKLAGGRHIDGAPDVVIEVLSPATALKDRREKRALYEAHGVAEYLLVAPEERTIEVFRRGGDGRYATAEMLGPDDRLTLTTLPGFDVGLGEALGWRDHDDSAHKTGQ